MEVISQRKLVEFCEEHAETRAALACWCLRAEAAEWRNLADIQADFPQTECVDGNVIFHLHSDAGPVTVITTLIHDRLFIRSVGK